MDDLLLARQLAAGERYTPARVRQTVHPRHAYLHLLHPSVTPSGRRSASSSLVSTSPMSTGAATSAVHSAAAGARVRFDLTEAGAAATAAFRALLRVRTLAHVSATDCSGDGSARISSGRTPARSRHVAHPYRLRRHFAHPSSAPSTSTARTTQSGGGRPLCLFSGGVISASPGATGGFRFTPFRTRERTRDERRSRASA